ncbi:dicarboxylate/amino acid:cation symporter [Microbacterium sp. APC 3898]|uniref:Dicarboxylate/amino acid:cation symporter n=2 Tax=Planococcus TaxID=1372 RepID=A0ABT7ZNR2_9BACL|nr:MULTISPECIES: dicarboxylate/amino acid:cation symporter [Terrabacteria group]MBF6634165.1 dicarboxylate/amino acid:cation symporter [Planococcus sp. (in: firmicutes)]MBD8016338.1 dicarboxylate/amino acid:cation symporter [Planococcus wigleyi]MDN3428812.1 dicarboxylate/amino acid:cation symporter [Planococcus sp. APC 4016]MDN3439327.1 dicarboxylate/amino acid:cation symporter [Planococcus sp. APC 3900]MDN3500067.1 dicarboxylate/amino acid:cation symporter [Microbacterium sp. APC 3898]
MKFNFGLLPRIIVAIVLGVLIGLVAPESMVRVFATFTSLFGNFLNFVVPLIILGFIAPGIAKLGKGSGKLLGMATGAAYASTIIAGVLAFFVAVTVLPNFMQEGSLSGMEDPEKALAATFITLDMPPVFGVMSALILAFLLGIGMASTGSKVMVSFFDEFQAIIEKTISYVIIPLLPFHIFGIFANMAYGGAVFEILSLFAIVFVMIIILHWVMLLLQYSTAGALKGRNPFILLKTMMPAYFTALGTQSSAATIPVTLRQARKSGANERVADFTVPLFATIHLSGSTITLVSCAIGVLLLTGGTPVFSDFFPFILMLGVTMIAAPGVPGGAVMAAIGLLEVMLGFDPTMVALMIALYMAQDSFGTAANVTGDGALAHIVDRFTNGKKSLQ